MSTSIQPRPQGPLLFVPRRRVEQDPGNESDFQYNLMVEIG